MRLSRLCGNFASSTASARGKALPQVIPASDGPAGRQHGYLDVAGHRVESAFQTLIINPRQVLLQYY